ncbi:hypothetical protein [Undibacterium sp. Ji49W]|uniref:hypothetical protein n=1 Tax=Undibacterium sp. Ji49W TaxID=3413040 RepID=UPI003BF2BCFE
MPKIPQTSADMTIPAKNKLNGGNSDPKKDKKSGEKVRLTDTNTPKIAPIKTPQINLASTSLSISGRLVLFMDTKINTLLD